MPLIAYRDYRPRRDAVQIIERANQILAISRADGFGVMTLRQIYYQFISRNWLPENSIRQYKKLGRILADAREGGLIDWNAIEDAQRNSFHFRDCPTPEQLLQGIEAGLLINPWHDQDVYVETWVEKQSLEATIARPCNSRRSAYMACKGYLSVSEAWRAGQRYEAKRAQGKRLVLLHLGDHDPSGIDMTRDNKDRLEFFAREHGIEVRRLALNMDQIEQYDPPPNFAKQTDSRFAGYERLYGTSSWELDALRQSVIGEIITSSLDSLIDKEKWEASKARERELRRSSRVGELAERWAEVHSLLVDDGLPMERLKAYEWISPKALADTLTKAREVVVAHDESNRGSLLFDMTFGADVTESVQMALDAIAVKAEEALTERAERRSAEPQTASEEDDESYDAEVDE